MTINLPRARQLFTLKPRVLVSLAPSFVSEFPEQRPAQLIRALKQLGFAAKPIGTLDSKSLEGAGGLIVGPMAFDETMGEQAKAVRDFAERGYEAVVATSFDRPLDISLCRFCGQCVDLCPTGALTNKQLKGTRPWERTTVRTTCPFCGQSGYVGGDDE